MNKNHSEISKLPRMQLCAAVVIFASSFPDPEVRHPVNSFYTKHKVLNKRDLEEKKRNVSTRATADAQILTGTITPV